MNRFEGFRTHCEKIQAEHRIELCLNDFSGLLLADTDFKEACSNLFIHRNVYCMAVKAHKSLWDRCLAKKTALRNRARSEAGGWYGLCYAGREEFSIPLRCQGEVLGTLSIGGFQRRADLSCFFAHRLCRENHLDRSDILNKLDRACSAGPLDDTRLEAIIALLAEYLELTYAHLATVQGRLFVPETATATTSHELLGHAIEFIRLHYAKPIGATDLAGFCHVSLSTLSHLFKKNLGMSIPARINAERVRHAQEHLRNTSWSVTAVANAVGFDDPNHFSRVFAALTGECPREFRKRHAA